MKPLISVIITAYNTELYIKEAIESVLAQTYPNLEIFVIDDGSTDKTKEIGLSFGDKITYIYQENRGESGARNTGIRHAKGEYVAFLDGDDIYLPSKIERQVEFLEAHPEYDIAYCSMYHFYDGAPKTLYCHQGHTPSGDVFGQLLWGFFGQADTLLIPRKIFDAVGLPPENYRFSIDFEMNLRMARAGYRFGFLDEPLLKIRIVPLSQSSFENQWKCKSCDLGILESYVTKLSPEENKMFKADRLMKRIHIRLAIAHMLAGQKKEAIQTLRRGGGFLLGSMSLFTAVVPASVLKAIAVHAWKRNRQNLLKESAAHSL